MMLGENIKAEEALRIGLLNKVVPSDRPIEEAKALAEGLAERPPIALKYAKAALNLSSQAPLSLGLKLESEALGIVASSKDAFEGISAFFEKESLSLKESSFINPLYRA